MVRVSNSLCIWSDRFDAHLENMLAAQAELAHKISKALPDVQSEAVQARERSIAVSQNVAHHACAMGFHHWQRRGRTALMKALTYFQDAIELEPRCAEAYAGLADTYVSLSYNHLMPARKAAESARVAIYTAVKLDRSSIKVRNALINWLMHCSWDLTAAEKECRDLLDAGSADVRTMQLYSSLMNLRGRHHDAIDLALRAYRLDPDSDLTNGQVSLAYFYAGDYGSALSFVRRTIDLQPQYLMGYALLGRTEAELGNWDDAISAFHRGLEVSNGCPFIKALLAYAYAGSGDAQKAQAVLSELEQDSHDECFPAYDVSAVHAILDQENEALQKMHKACGTRDMKTIFLLHDPRFARLRNSAEFQQIASTLYAEVTPSLRV
jgi:serine/threonine-protein kinase